MSVVWELFTRQLDVYGKSDTAECKICEKQLKAPSSRTTTSLLYHLEKNHRSELEKARGRKTSTPEPKKIQATLQSSFRPTLSAEKRKAIHRRLVVLIADSSMSLRLPSTRSFKKFVEALHPGFTPPPGAP